MLNKSWLLPNKVLKIYEETHAALSNNMTILAGIGVGVLVEAVCNEKNATGSNLKDRIDSLVTLGILTKESAEILHTVRGLRNLSAHNISEHDIETLENVMDVVENLLQSVYIVPIIAKRLKIVQDHNL